MKSKLFFALTVIVAVAGLSISLVAHHGANLYDSTKAVMMKGTITQFEWGNPHNQIYFDVKDASGNVVHWAGELNSPGVLTGQGWSRKMFLPGDEITLSVFPSKAGAAVGVVDRAKPIISNGKEVVPAGRNVD